MEGTPKWDSELVRISSAPALVAGSTNGMVIRRMTYHCLGARDTGGFFQRGIHALQRGNHLP